MLNIANIESFGVALVSIVLYSSLAVTSSYLYLRLKKEHHQATSEPDSANNASVVRGNVINCKKIFFLVLAVTSMADIPVYVACVYHGGPQDCEWGDNGFITVWVLHVVALSGYAIALGIPLFLWSDIVNGRDGKLWNSRFKFDAVKTYLYVTVISYLVLKIITVCAIIMGYHPRDGIQFENVNLFNEWTSILECLYITIIAAGWLVFGMTLRRRLKMIKFQRKAERKILFVINLTMLTIFFAYLLRAVMVMTLLPAFVVKKPTVKYFAVWIIGTRWLPYVFCSYLLIYIMRRSQPANEERASIYPSGIASDDLDAADPMTVIHGNLEDEALSGSDSICSAESDVNSLVSDDADRYGPTAALLLN